MDNSKFALQNIELDIYNSALHNLKIKSATLRVSTVLNGIRYYMQTWFFTSAIAFILTLTMTISCTMMGLLLILKVIFKI